MRHKILILLSACCLVITLGSVANASDIQADRADTILSSGDAAAAKTVSPTNIYIVQLQGDPIVA